MIFLYLCMCGIWGNGSLCANYIAADHDSISVQKNGVWDNYRYFKFCDKLRVNDSIKSLHIFMYAADSCELSSWLKGKEAYGDEYLKALPNVVLCRCWGLFSESITKTSSLWNECIIKQHRRELLEYAKNDKKMSKNRKIMLQLRDPESIRNVKLSIMHAREAKFIADAEREKLWDDMKMVRRYLNRDDVITTLAALSTSQAMIREWRVNQPLRETYFDEILKMNNDNSERDWLHQHIMKRNLLHSNGERDQVSMAVSAEIVRYLKRNFGIGEFEIKRYLESVSSDTVP